MPTGDRPGSPTRLVLVLLRRRCNVADPPLSGFSHPRYSVVRELGHGALTSTFEALALYSGTRSRRVALKVLGHPEHSRWYSRTCWATAALSHPSIAACLEIADAQGSMFMALEFVPGTSLIEEITRGTKWSDANVVRVVRDVAAALDCAHVQGVIHGYLHPRHILLTADHLPHVIGFAEYPMPPCVPIGNPIHLAPEQLLDDVRLVPQTDVFALTEIAFWMLAGTHPYAGPGLTEQLIAKSTGPRQSLRQLRPDLPATVDEVLRSGMAPKPEDRFPSAGALSESLAAALLPEAPRENGG